MSGRGCVRYLYRLKEQRHQHGNHSFMLTHSAFIYDDFDGMCRAYANVPNAMNL